MSKVTRIFETVLYADDLDAAVEFYSGILGMEVIQRSELFITFRCEDGVLLVFDPVRSSKPGRSVPAHGTSGPGHVAFVVQAEELDSWHEHLRNHGVEIEAEVEWKTGGISLYIRDPADNSVELAPPTLWGGGWKS